MSRSIFYTALSLWFLVTSCAPLAGTMEPAPSPTAMQTPISAAWPSPEPRATLAPTIVESDDRVTSPNLDDGCAAVEGLSPDSAEAQRIVEEFVQNFKAQQPTEYMGMAILHSVDRLDEWAVVQGSVSGEGKDVIAVVQTPQGYQLAERYTITAPLESLSEDPERVIPEYFIEALPDAPAELFTCQDQSWLIGQAAGTTPTASSSLVNDQQLAYLSLQGDLSELFAIRADGSDKTRLLSERRLILDLDASPDGELIAFSACPGSFANDCLPNADLDIMTIDWNGTNLRNLTASRGDDWHPDWSPDGQIAFDSNRSGNHQIYIMNSDGSKQRALTNQPGQNSEPTWSPDGKWIAYHCMQASEIQICVLSPDGQPAGEPISGTTPVWSPAGLDEGVRLAFLCFQRGHSDVCMARPDGSELANLSNNAADEHSPTWSSDGQWLAFVSNRGDDIDIYKVCVTCPGEPFAVRLTDEPRAAGWPAWSPDGSRVAYVAGEDLMVVNADRSDATYLTSGVLSPPIWRP